MKHSLSVVVLVAMIVVGVAGITAQESPAATTAEPERDTTSSSATADLDRHRNILSSLWAFATLNYLYCDVVGLMDSSMLNEYLDGEVGGVEMNDEFLLGATILMEVPMSMVFLSQVLQPRALRIANIGAGILMTSVQTATLFVGEPSSYYLFSSIVEIATTGFITAYAFRALEPSRLQPSVAVGHDSLGVRVRFQI